MNAAAAMQDTEQIAQRLHAMVDGGAPEPMETRSLESPATPITAAQLDMIWGYGPTRSGVQINEHTALTYSAVFAAVKILAESIGMLPLAVFEGDDDEDVRTRAKDHPAYPLLRWEANPEMTAVVFKESVQANLTSWGNGYARILEDNAGRPRQLLPLQSDRTHPERYAGQLRYDVEGGGGRFAPEEVIHIPGLSLNGIRGLSPIGLAREAVALGKAAEIFGATFFGNGAQLGGAIEVPGVLKPEQLNTLRESWNAMHAGSGNAHKTGILQGGAKYARIGIPPEDAQFLETRKFQVTEVARIYRIPPHMLGDLERATNANIEQQSLEFLIYTLLPWLEKWEQELTRKLCGTRGEYHVKFDDRRLMRADMAARQKFYESGRQWGYLNADDVLRFEGMPPLPDKLGQIYLSPANMVTAENAGKVGVSGAAPAPDLGKDKPAAKQAGDPPVAPVASTRSAEVLLGVFADATGRMLRKEANARGRGKADDRFYAEHAGHVREALTPATDALVSLMRPDAGGETRNAALTVIEQFATEQHAQPPETTEVAARLVRRITEVIE